MMASKEILYFTHIPKCGGQSFKRGLEKAYGDRVQMWYVNPLRHRLKDKASFKLSRLKWHFWPAFPDSEVRIVYGHYSFEDLKVPQDAKVSYAAFFREPIEWFGSFYFYIRNKYPGELPDDPVKLIKKMDLSNAFQKYLGKISVNDLRFVGITESYEKSLLLYYKMFGVEVDSFHVNKTNVNISEGRAKYANIFQDMGIWEEINSHMANNRLVYEEGKKKYCRLCREYSVR